LKLEQEVKNKTASEHQKNLI